MSIKPVPAFTPSPFDELGKDSLAILFVDSRKDWAALPNKDTLKWELKAADGVKNIIKFEREADGRVNGSLEVKLPVTPSLQLEPSLTVDTKRKVKIAFAQNGRLFPGLKVTAAIEALLDKKTEDLKLDFDYKRPGLVFVSKLTLPIVKYVPGFASASAGVKNALVLGFEKDLVHQASLGGEADYSLADGFVKTFNLFLQYRNVAKPLNAFTAAAYSRQSYSQNDKQIKQTKNNVGLLLHSRFARFLGPNAEVSTQFDYDLNKEKDAVTLAVGSAWEVSNGGRVSVLFNTRNQLQTTYSQKVADNVSLKLGAEISGEAASITRGFFEVNFTD